MYKYNPYRHLDGTVMHFNGEVLDALSRPSLMITDAYNSLVIHPPRKQRESDLFGMCICLFSSWYYFILNKGVFLFAYHEVFLLFVSY